MKKQKNQSSGFIYLIRLFVTGFVMGAADIVPGVSGGTIAFIFGIYQTLIDSIKLMSGRALQLVLKGKVMQALSLVPFSFLVPLGLGLLTAVLTLSSLLETAFTKYPVYIWSYFFGLVLISIWVVKDRVANWSASAVTGLAVGVMAAYIIVGLVPVETPSNLFMYFISGVIAICAMILPGISGSFLLVIMGKYNQVLAAVNERNILVLVVFTLGCVIGLSIFSRVLSYLFNRYHDITVALLTGFMIGSLRKVWPWKTVIQWGTGPEGELIALRERSYLPASLNMEVMLAITLCIAGVLTIVILHKIQEKARLPEEI